MHKEDDIAWIEAGEGTPVLFLHGMPGSKRSWAPQMEVLSPNFRVIAWDMPGYGSSPLQPELQTPSQMADCISAFLQNTLSIDSVHVVGLSLGGMIAMELALALPNLVKSLTMVDSSPRFGHEGGGDAKAFIDSVAEPLNNGTSVSDLCADILKDLLAPSTSQAIFDTAHSAMSDASGEGLVQAATLIGNHDALSRLEQIDQPTLVMVGVEDTATPPAYSQDIAKLIPNSQYIEISNAGHLSNLENSQEFNRYLQEFLSKQAEED